MQAQTEKGSLLGELKLKTVTTTVKEVSPLGIRIEQNQDGDFVGRYIAHHIATRETFLKPDGSSEWNAVFYQRTQEGDIVYGTAHGTRKMTDPTTSKGESEAIIMTESPKLSWLNMKKAKGESTVDIATGETHFKMYLP